MATAEQYANWIVQNADKRGTPEFETVAQAYKAARSGAPAEESRSAADDTGLGEALLVGAGRGTDQVLKGVKQLYYKATGNKDAEQKLADQQKEESDLYAPLQAKFPIATAIGESAPAMAIPLGSAGAVGTILRSAAANALPEALKYGTAEERLKRGGVGFAGGAVGGGVAQTVGRVLKPAGVGIAGASDDALGAAERIGFKPSPGDMSGNPAMKNFENYLSKSPGSSGRMLQFNNANQTAISTTAAKAMGETADNLGEGTFKAAKSRIGNEFNRLSDKTTADLSKPRFLQSLVDIETSNTARGPYSNPEITAHLEKALELASKGQITGKVYKEIRTEISSQADKAFKNGDSTLGQALQTIRGEIDAAAKGSLSKADQAAWDTARQQWQAYKTLITGNVAEGGEANAGRVAAAVRRDAPDAFRTGQLKGPLIDVAKVGESFKGVANPNSGNLNQGMLYGNPITGLPLMAGNYLAGAAYMGAPKYFGKGLIDIGQGGARELTRGMGLLSDPATKHWLGAE